MGSFRDLKGFGANVDGVVGGDVGGKSRCDPHRAADYLIVVYDAIYRAVDRDDGRVDRPVGVFHEIVIDAHPIDDAGGRVLQHHAPTSVVQVERETG